MTVLATGNSDEILSALDGIRQIRFRHRCRDGLRLTEHRPPAQAFGAVVLAALLADHLGYSPEQLREVAEEAELNAQA